MYNLVVITDPQSKCCHIAVIWLGTKTSIISDQKGSLQAGGEAGDVPTRTPGPAWKCVIMRCLLATSLRASTTQEKYYLPETQDSSYLCNYKPRRKANNASVPYPQSLLEVQRVYHSTQNKFPDSSQPALNRPNENSA